MSETATDIEVALSAAATGAAVVRAAYGAELIRHTKVGSDFATDADLDAERAILKVIDEARPYDGRLGEETGGVDGNGQRRWLVDPLCGTGNFAAQTPLVAVNVSLVEGSTTLVSVSADPIAGEYFWTDGRCSYVRIGETDDELGPCRDSCLVDVNCDGPADRPFLGPQLVGDPDFRAAFGPRVLSTTLALAWVAAGRRAAYVGDGWFDNNVHFTAGIALCRDAGCSVTDLAGQPLKSGRGLIAAADTETHEQLVEIIRPHLDAVLL